jgi:hypothetical protein
MVKDRVTITKSASLHGRLLAVRQQEMHRQKDVKVQTAQYHQGQEKEVQRSGAERFR